MTTNCAATAARRKTTMSDNYEGPVRLQRAIPWRKKDKATADAVFNHMRVANPPLIIPWSPKRKKIVDLLDRYNVHPATLRDLRVMFERARKFSDGVSGGRFVHWLGNAYEQIAKDFANVVYSPAYRYPRPEFFHIDWTGKALDEGVPPRVENAT
jgi:hypothetical protein